MIRPIDAMNVLKYLAGAQAITLTEDQDAVWADYINDSLPQAQPADLLPAARRAVRDWSQGGRAWRVDVERFVSAVRAIRADRITAVGVLPTPPAELTAGEAVQWQRALVRLIGDGRDVADARDRADRLVGYTRLPEVEDGPVMDVKELINNARSK